jgi:SAM-dependent methyltransferase
VSEEREKLIAEFGPWTTPVYLGEGIRTCETDDPSRGTRLQRLVQVVEDATGGPFRALRILDLACLEGMVSVELARQGARVLGIEARPANVAKARFAKKALGLDNLEFEQDDVRNVSRKKYGGFDVVLCLGILYHLPAPDVFDFVQNLADVTDRVAVIDTHVSLPETSRKLLGAPESIEHRGRTYRGRPYREFEPDSSEADRLKWAWSTLDSRPSFWPTAASLFNLLDSAGFTSIHEVRTPRWIGIPEDRVTLLAFKGTRVTVSRGASEPVPTEAWPEE